METTEKNIRDLAKATACATMAGLTALGGGAVPSALACTAIPADVPMPDATATEVVAAPPSDTITSDDITDAKHKLDAANETLAAATVAKDSTARTVTSARDTLAKATATHDSLAENAAKAEAAAKRALDDAKAQASANVQASYDRLSAARTASDAAWDAKQQADEALTKAEREAADARAAYEEALATAPDLPSTKAESDSASAALEQATQAHDKASTDLSTAKDALADAQSALRSAQSDVASAQSAYDAASAHLATARAAHDKAAAALQSSNATPKRIAELEAALAQTESDLSRATSDAKNAETELATARRQADSAKAAEKSAQETYDAAKAAYEATDAETAKTQADAAKKAHEDALAAESQAKADAEAANARLSELAAAKDASEKILADAKAKALAAESELSRATAELDEARESCSTIVSLKDFFAEEDSVVALKQFERTYKQQPCTEVNESTHSGEAGDATDYRNVLAALDTLRDVNAVRASLGLPEFQVIDELMARETVSTNWSATHVAHSPNCGNENLAWGWDDPVSGWYDYEKTIYDAALETNSFGGEALPEGWQDMTGAQLQRNAPAFHDAVGHYIHVVNPGYLYAGAACHDADDTISSICFGQVYRSYSYDVRSYTVDEWEERFMGWVAGKLAQAAVSDESAAAVIAAQEALQVSQMACDDALLDLSESLSHDDANALAYEKAAIAAHDAEEILTRASGNSVSTQLASERADQAYSDALAAAVTFADARMALESAQSAVSEADSLFAEKTETHAACLTRMETAKTACESLSAQRDAAVREHDELASAERETAAELEDRERAELAASSALADANAEVSGAASIANDLASVLADRQRDVNRLADELDAAYARADAAWEQMEAAESLMEEIERLSVASSGLDAAHEFAADMAEKARKSTVAADDAVLAAENAYQDACSRYEMVRDLSYDSALSFPGSVPELSHLAGALSAAKGAIAESEEAERKMEAAGTLLSDAEEAYRRAYDEWVEAVAFQALAQESYDAMTSDSPEPSAPDANPDVPSETEVPSVPAQPTKPTPVVPIPDSSGNVVSDISDVLADANVPATEKTDADAFGPRNDFGGSEGDEIPGSSPMDASSYGEGASPAGAVGWNDIANAPIMQASAREIDGKVYVLPDDGLPTTGAGSTAETGASAGGSSVPYGGVLGVAGGMVTVGCGLVVLKTAVGNRIRGRRK